MGKLKSIDFERCTSGIEFEDWTKDLLRDLSFNADRVGKNDSGVDVIAKAQWNGKVYRFYIQCKYYNKPVGKTPVHEIFAGTAFHKDYGRPVVIINNTMTYEARRYAKELGVEVIAEPEWDEFENIIKTGTDSNPNPRDGLFGMMIASLLNKSSYIPQSLINEDPEASKSRQELQLQIISDFDEAKELSKEAGRLQLRAAQYQERALEIQKRAMLRNIAYD